MTDGTMTGIDYFAWLVLIVIIVATVAVFVALAQLPGQIAQKRGHPQADAINAAGWLGLLLTLGVVWALAVIWALAKPAVPRIQADTSTDETGTEPSSNAAQEAKS
ncbi:MAG: DUF3302 domain-containing protein [Gammaproteobacteria bacterium]